MTTPRRQTVNFSSYPDLVVIYLGDANAFAPLQPARGGMFSSRGRLGVGGEPEVAPVYSEQELYEA